MTLKAAGRLTQLNNENRLAKILERCPNFVKFRWQSRVQEIRSYHREPTVEDVRCLIRTMSFNGPIAIPWKHNPPDPPNNRPMAQKGWNTCDFGWKEIQI